MQAWVDRWQALRRRVLSDKSIAQLVADLAAEVDPAAAARDAARWPDNASRFPGGFQGEVDHLRDWMQRRAGWIDDQFVAPPSVTYANEVFVLTPASGAELIYTLDGSDPRAPGGAPAEGAITSAGPVTLEAQHNFRARSYLAARADAFPGSPWSAPLTASDLPGSARIINVSTRAFAGSGEAVLIAGFYVAGSEPRRFLVRAVGPALANFGVEAPLADPRLRVIGADGTEVSRDRYWWSGTNAAGLAEIMHDAGAFALAEESNDAATVVELAPGAYTVVVDDLQNREGIALAEVYALEAEHARTINVSSRAFVHPQAEQTLMAGLLVRGDTPKRLLVRGVGPSLSQYGVNQPLADPVLTIWRDGVAVASNDDWNATPELLAATADSGAFALTTESRDAALIVVLPPGDYTAHVTGKGEEPGIALVEMYEIP